MRDEQMDRRTVRRLLGATGAVGGFGLFTDSDTSSARGLMS